MNVQCLYSRKNLQNEAAEETACCRSSEEPCRGTAVTAVTAVICKTVPHPSGTVHSASDGTWQSPKGGPETRRKWQEQSRTWTRSMTLPSGWNCKDKTWTASRYWQYRVSAATCKRRTRTKCSRDCRGSLTYENCIWVTWSWRRFQNKSSNWSTWRSWSSVATTCTSYLQRSKNWSTWNTSTWNKTNWELQQELFELSKLKTLLLDMNNVSVILAEVGKLQSLEEISLEYNPLAFVPAALVNLPNLMVLRVVFLQVGFFQVRHWQMTAGFFPVHLQCIWYRGCREILVCTNKGTMALIFACQLPCPEAQILPWSQSSQGGNKVPWSFVVVCISLSQVAHPWQGCRFSGSNNELCTA